jgi:methionyl-tRNA synthetase
VGYGSDDAEAQATFERRWPAQLHFVGKDIIRFHCVIWPAMLMAAGLELPQRVFAHGFLLTKGEKMSKSKGNAVSPLDLAKIFGVCAYRYYFLSDVQFGADGSISIERMTQVYNADLANSWGNLCSRVFNMTHKYFDGVVPTLGKTSTTQLSTEMGNPLAALVASIYERYTACMHEVDYSGAIAVVQELVARANLYLEESAPWAIAKRADAEEAQAAEGGGELNAAHAITERERLAFVLYNNLEAIRIAAVLFAPVMPRSSCEVWQRLELDNISDITNLRAVLQWGQLPAGNKITVGEPLFPRLDVQDIEL